MRKAELGGADPAEIEKILEVPFSVRGKDTPLEQMPPTIPQSAFDRQELVKRLSVQAANSRFLPQGLPRPRQTGFARAFVADTVTQADKDRDRYRKFLPGELKKMR